MDYTIVDGILSGESDEALDAIGSAVRDRQAILDTRKGDGLAIGDKVVFNDRTSPKYMIGVEATVTGKKQKKVVVEIDTDQGRFKAGHKITTAPSLLDILTTSNMGAGVG